MDKPIRLSRPGYVDMIVNDFSLLSSVKIAITKIVLPMYKEGKHTYIVVKDQLDVRDIIELGDYSILYRAMHLKKLNPRGGYVYRIKRVDGFNITSQDIQGTHIGGKVKIKNRRSFQQMFKAL